MSNQTLKKKTTLNISRTYKLNLSFPLVEFFFEIGLKKLESRCEG